MITLIDYWMGRDAIFVYELTDEIRANAQVTVHRANLLLAEFGAETNDKEQRRVTSGWRPVAINGATAGAALRSKHISAQAVDIEDHEGDLDQWCLDHPSILAGIGLWQEHPSATKGWTHVQIVPPKSGNRVFYP